MAQSPSAPSGHCPPRPPSAAAAPTSDGVAFSPNMTALQPRAPTVHPVRRRSPLSGHARPGLADGPGPALACVCATWGEWPSAGRQGRRSWLGVCSYHPDVAAHRGAGPQLWGSSQPPQAGAWTERELRAEGRGGRLAPQARNCVQPFSAPRPPALWCSASPRLASTVPSPTLPVFPPDALCLWPLLSQPDTRSAPRHGN